MVVTITTRERASPLELDILRPFLIKRMRIPPQKKKKKKKTPPGNIAQLRACMVTH